MEQPVGAPAPDAELEAAVRALHTSIELSEVLRTIGERARAWSGAASTLALAPGEQTGRLALFGDALPAVEAEEPPRTLDAARVHRMLGDKPVLFEGPGPIAALVGPDGTPEVVASGAVPLTDASGRWRGALLLLFIHRPEHGALARAAALAQAGALAFDHALQVHALRQLVIKDDTAQCYNRRYFEDFLPEELARASRFRAPLSLIFLDMDNLKEVNSRYGHATGSRVLNEVAGRIRRRIRKFDKLFRFGGDEFCILLPETEWHGALEVAERARDAVRDRPFDVVEGDRPAEVWMSASLGVAAFPLHARNAQELVQLADRAMQQIKRGAKNGVAVAESERSPHGR